MSKRFGQVEKDVAKFVALANGGKPLSGEHAKTVLKEVEALGQALARFVARAAETDEEKKMYGPKMCAKVRVTPWRGVLLNMHGRLFASLDHEEFSDECQPQSPQPPPRPIDRTC